MDANRPRSWDESSELRAREAQLGIRHEGPDGHATGAGAADVAPSASILRDREPNAAAALESAAQGIVIVGPDGAIQTANACAERLFGYRREELIGQPLELLMPASLRAAHAGNRHDYFASPRPRPMGQGLDRTAIRKDGTKFPVEIGLSFVDTAEGRLAIVLVTDITARKQAEANLEREHEALHRAERLATLVTLAASIAHEINNPIGIIASRTELALTELEGTSLPPTLREDLDVIQRNVERVAQIPTACWPSRTARPASGDPSISTGSLRRRCSSSARSWQDPASRSA